jgi:alkylation response protein AidB-like acyl-CoA dehydrogenase
MLSRPSPASVPAAEQHWVDTVAALADDFAKTAQTDDLAARLPVEHLQALSAAGVDAAFLPRAHGGEDLSYATLGRIVQVLASRHPAVATLWLMHIGAAHALVTLSSPAEAAFFAGELRAGRRFANALSEPAGGNYFLASQQDAEPVDGGWSLTGRKLFVSGSEAADHLFLNARVEGAPAFFGVTIDDTVSFPPIEETSGMRSTRSRTIVFDDTILHQERLCGPPAPEYANLITVGFAFISIGIAEAALDALRDHAARRKGPEATALADTGWVRSETGMMWAEVEATRLMAERAAWLADHGSTEAMPAATETKMLANEIAKRAAALAVRVGGGSGYLMSSPIQRISRDAQAGAIMAYSVPFSRDLVGGWVLASA